MKQDEMEEQATAEQSWQEALDPGLTQRLLRPVVQPGLNRSQMAGAIQARSQGLTGRLPLLGQVVQRYRMAEDLGGQVPIVYARLRSDDLGPAGALTVPPKASPPQLPVAQARVTPPAEPGARPVASGVRAVTQRAPETGPTGALPVVQPQALRPAEPRGRPVAGRLRAVIQRAPETDLTGVLPIVRPTAEPPAEPGARPDAGSQRAVIQRAVATAPTGVVPIVQPQAPRPAELADRPAVVARPIKAGERQGRPASAAPARPVVAPSRSAGQTRAIQRSLDRLVVVEARRPGWSATPPPQAFQRPVSVSNRGQPVGHGAAPVVQRAASGSVLSPPAGAGQTAPPVVQEASVEAQVDLEELAERVQRELDMEALVAKVQRQLKQRLAVESERRGRVQWP
jgi:hypothetical protein